MNVLEAIEEINKIETNISFLRRTINKINSDAEFNVVVDTIEEIIIENIEKRDRLKYALSVTRLDEVPICTST